MSNEAESILGNCTTKEQIITESVDSTRVANCGFISLAWCLIVMGIRSFQAACKHCPIPSETISIILSSVAVNSAFVVGKFANFPP